MFFLLGLFLGWGLTVIYFHTMLGKENHKSKHLWNYRSWLDDDPGYVVFKGIKKNGECEFNADDILLASQSDDDESDKPLY